MNRITTVKDLEEIIGKPLQAAAEKGRPTLHALDRAWLAASPLVFVGTVGVTGADVSPKGDPAGGLVHVIDDTTIAIPERPGNRRADGFHNLLRDPRVGLEFVIPGRGDTLRVTGTATIVSDAPWFDDLVVRGHRPILAMVVEIQELFHHCSKAFLRSKTWEPETWDPEAVPRRALIAQALERQGEDIEALDAYYGSPSYGAKIYG